MSNLSFSKGGSHPKEYIKKALKLNLNCFACMNINRHQALWEINYLNSNKKMSLIHDIKKLRKAVKLPCLLLGKQIKTDLKKFGLTLSEYPLKLLRPILENVTYTYRKKLT